MTLSQITTFPNEILTHIASYLKAGSKNYVNFSCACKLFYEIANYNVLWRSFAKHKGIKIIPEDSSLKKRIDRTFKQALSALIQFESLSIDSRLRTLAHTHINLPKILPPTAHHLPASCYPSTLAIVDACKNSFELDFTTGKTPNLWQILLQSSRHHPEEFMKVFYFYISSCKGPLELEYSHHPAKAKFLIYSFLALLSKNVYLRKIITNINLIKNHSDCKRAVLYTLNPVRWTTPDATAKANPDDDLHSWLNRELTTSIELPEYMEKLCRCAIRP